VWRPGPSQSRSSIWSSSPVLKGALIVFNGGHCTLGCQILDMSETGALVRPSDILLCPSEFVLQPRVGSPRYCEVVWRKTDMVGVRYI